ncbi:MAG: HupE/UreJ family protein [Casimicrobiaceae bacterium]|nr:HupE/UreJ family protein [Casimicrobiaceae bacterium]MCX8098701.1 HupE/UreJ family protein [Casimicrobiaceae bacterium]MDW8312140.1 HupE/UreJ family protein [Burkholderiales bacterium]
MTITMHRLRMTPLTLLLAVFPALALAHGAPGDHAHEGFAAGFLHPLTGLDHLLAMLTVGFWSALGGAHDRRRWLVPLAFLLLLAVGALAARAGLTLPAVEPIIAASLLVLGLVVATAMHIPVALMAALVAAFALFHGAAHGQELVGDAALLGMLLATLGLHLLGYAAGRLLTARQAAERGLRLARALGAFVAAFGLGLMASGWLA